ncbi:heme biosynthesis protein HemY [Novimethylophilus kurashikiensis]|uniref:Heme biosynthesis protein HemY n=1 Tax=Novimethylophilus kurashikiensis TaxID=1825523 RepID=A0A2R5FA46_9PROT|nr:tRNA cyclic N6-threonylcarbamoyladenosine(37) synthase TcdA [Novimethylophilus kurashikiensis]GBG15100.1 heme biosynthesis protein HemY [Novimethylophilus kurashikiensis]
MEVDFERRFGGVARLYGIEALERFRKAHVCVIGIGGVGSWAVEALARSAIGRLTLIDLDHVAESNTNRQIHALGEEFGKAKTSAMAERISAINPYCSVEEVEDFVTEDNLDALLGRGYDYVIDAIDQTRVKAALIAWCKRHDVKLITTGSAGGQVDPSRIKVDDLSRTIQDPLASRMRSLLRKNYGFPRDVKKKFGVECVYSDEPLKYPDAGQACEVDQGGVTGLNCAGFGSSVCVTASFGFVAASRVLMHLAK